MTETLLLSLFAQGRLSTARPVVEQITDPTQRAAVLKDIVRYLGVRGGR